MASSRRHLAAEVGRFLAVGGVATLVSFSLFNLLLHGVVVDAVLADRPITAYLVANTVGMFVSYTGSRHFAFRDRPARHRDGGRSAYVVINVATMTLPVACLWLSRHVLGLDDPLSDNLAANVVGLGLGIGARFYLFRTLVFRRPIHLVEIYGEPDLVPLVGLDPDEVDEVLERVTGPATAPATSAPATPRAS